MPNSDMRTESGVENCWRIDAADNAEDERA